MKNLNLFYIKNIIRFIIIILNKNKILLILYFVYKYNKNIRKLNINI